MQVLTRQHRRGFSRTLLALFLLAMFGTQAWSRTPKETRPPNQPWAVLHTTMGSMIIELYERYVPKTVAHFIALAEGTKAWRDPKTKKMVTRPFYDGLLIHRIVPTYWIQLGSPTGTSRGGPGFTIKDEFHPKLRHVGPGIVSMANAGPNRNGSQFFITLRTAPWLDLKVQKGRFCANFRTPIKCLTDAHCRRYKKMFPAVSSGSPVCKQRIFKRGFTIFGKVVHGLRVLTKIADQPVDVNGHPINKIKIKRVVIYRAKRWQRRWLRTTP